MYYWKTCSNGSHTLFRKTQSDRQTLALAGNIGIANSSITSDACYAILTLVPVSHCEHSYYNYAAIQVYVIPVWWTEDTDNEERRLWI